LFYFYFYFYFYYYFKLVAFGAPFTFILSLLLFFPLLNMILMEHFIASHTLGLMASWAGLLIAGL